MGSRGPLAGNFQLRPPGLSNFQLGPLGRTGGMGRLRELDDARGGSENKGGGQGGPFWA